MTANASPAAVAPAVSKPLPKVGDIVMLHTNVSSEICPAIVLSHPVDAPYKDSLDLKGFSRYGDRLAQRTPPQQESGAQYWWTHRD